MTDSFEPATPPSVLPIFPLTGALLLPGGRLPLYIFEPRYCAMVEDVMAGPRCIGMVQPLQPNRADNRGAIPAADGDSTPEVYPVGCVGQIERCETMPYGRFVLLLRGLGRFRVVRELDEVRGYRRVEATYDDFLGDRAEVDAEVDAAPLLAALERFGREHQVTVELEQLETVSGLALLTSIAAALPFAPAEQQALLEAPDLAARHELLLALLAMGLQLDRDDADAPN
ncbi:MAG: LON peptidase substrate-binding domain-containing protein [Acidobacteriota bacterium]